MASGPVTTKEIVADDGSTIVFGHYDKGSGECVYTWQVRGGTRTGSTPVPSSSRLTFDAYQRDILNKKPWLVDII